MAFYYDKPVLGVLIFHPHPPSSGCLVELPDLRHFYTCDLWIPAGPTTVAGSHVPVGSWKRAIAPTGRARLVLAFLSKYCCDFSPPQKYLL